MKKYLPLLVLLATTQLTAHAQAIHPYASCPNVNIAIVRAGNNADTLNPYYLYNVNQATGTMALVLGGPYKDPARPTKNLQINGIGVNRQDGFIYGIVFDGTVTTARLFRADSTYGVTNLGSIPSPYSGSGLLGFVNPAAGEMDTSGNYYFSAFTVAPFPSPHLDKFYIGKISNVQSLTGAFPPTVNYYEVDVSGANCGAYVSTFTSDPNNSGLKDFSYNGRTKTFYSYATYKLPGATQFSGQLVQLVPVAGSNPLRYQLVCNPQVNMHNAETSGTIIDASGKFTVLFTDGSFGMLNSNGAGDYTGAFTLINPATGLPNPLRGDMGSCGLGAALPIPPPRFNCPGNIGIARAGMNGDITNPYYLYTVNGLTGAFSLIPGGPVRYPGTSTNVQLNGIGVNKIDGMIYGMAYEGSINTARLVKVDLAYNVTLLGNIPPPVSATGPLSFVNSAAGDIDSAGNYWFTAVTARPGAVPGTLQLDKLWLGKIPTVQNVAGTPTPQYYEVDWTHALCQDYISSFTTDPLNSGIKDLYFHPVTGTFFSYATYRMPGETQYRGQVVELRPIGNPSSPSGYRLFCSNVVNTHTSETSGTMLSSEGNFLVLMTDGTVGVIPRSGSSYNYPGQYQLLNGSTGLPSPLRGDLASCTNIQGRPVRGIVPRQAFEFSLHPNPYNGAGNIQLTWRSEDAQTVSIVVYDNTGNPVRTIAGVNMNRGDHLSIYVGDLSAGIYYIKAISATGSYQVKFVKVN